MKKFLFSLIFIITLLSMVSAVSFTVGAWAYKHVTGGGENVTPWNDWIVTSSTIPGRVRNALNTVFGEIIGIAPELVIHEALWNDGTRAHQFPQPMDPAFCYFLGSTRARRCQTSD
jgi:hypothetical protein